MVLSLAKSEFVSASRRFQPQIRERGGGGKVNSCPLEVRWRQTHRVPLPSINQKLG